MNNIYLYIIVFISGASVLAVEILGTRILGPFYGVNLFLWSALISVTLVALSIGYLIGGRWADKGPKLIRLSYLMAGAGIWLLVIPWIKQPLLHLSEPLGLRAAVLVAAFFLFAPPLTLLGMISPYAVRIKTLDIKKVGRTAGDLYAISTIGSVVSALLTGFILIPNIGIASLTSMIGISLLIFAIPGLLSKPNIKTINLTVLLGLLIGSGILLSFSSDHTDADKGLLAIEQSPYAEIRVIETDNTRYLIIDGGTHTIVKTGTWEARFPYTAVVDLSRKFFNSPGEMLLIGLGGGTIVKNFAGDGWKVDAVEIDPTVVKVAYNYFGLKKAEGNIYCMDGRQFLLSDTKKYEIIVLDAFGSSSIPFHLITQESFKLIASKLKVGGILALNLESLKWDDLIVRSLSATLKNVFSKVLALPTHSKPDELGNIVLFASNNDLQLPLDKFQWEIQSDEYLLSLEYRREYAWKNRFEPNTEKAQILTDDLNPIDLWAEDINQVARKELHGYFEHGLSW